MSDGEGDPFSKWKYLPIKHVVFQSPDFIVYIDQELDIDWRVDGIADINNPEHFKIINEAAILEAIPCDGFSDQSKLQFRRLIAEGIARSLQSDYESGRQIHSAAREFLLARSQEVSRRWYLTASLSTAFVFVVLGILAWIERIPLRFILGTEASWLPLATMFGALGACFSVITRTGQQSFDCSAGRTLHYLEASSRIFAGALAGILAFLAVRADLVFSAISRGSDLHLIAILAAMAAGTSERLATSIISKLDEKDLKLESH